MSSPYFYGGGTAPTTPPPRSPYFYGGGTASPPARPAAPTRKLNPLDATYGTALAQAQEGQGLQHADAWNQAHNQLAILMAGIGANRLGRQEGLDHSSLLNSLASRGLGRSGAVGYGEGQQALNYNDKRFDLNNNLLQQLVGNAQQLINAKQAIRNATQGAYHNAFVGGFGG